MLSFEVVTLPPIGRLFSAHTVRLATLLLAGLLLSVRPATAQSPDTTDVPAVRSHLPDGHSPRGALIRALVPGWGQIYNRQYYKLPFVYVGLGGLLAGAIYQHERFSLYNRAFLFAAWYADERRDYSRFEADFNEALSQQGRSPVTDTSSITGLSSGLRRSRDNFMRNRNLLLIGFGLYYGLTVLDAYVSAHLLTFDVGEDLTVRMHPLPLRPGLRATLRFGR